MLKQIRKAKHLSIPALSRLSGISVRTIEKIEKTNGCTVRTAKCLALALNVSLDYLCLDCENEKEDKKMKALSLNPVYALQVFVGMKTIECRSWKTDYRGDILICSTAKHITDTIPSHALCIVRLADIVPFTRKHLEAAQMSASDYKQGQFAWIFEDLRYIKPFPVKGKLSLWECDEEIKVLPWMDDGDPNFIDYWDSLFV